MDHNTFLKNYLKFKLNIEESNPSPLTLKLERNEEGSLRLHVLAFGCSDVLKLPKEGSIDGTAYSLMGLEKSQLYSLSGSSQTALLVRYLVVNVSEIQGQCPAFREEILSKNVLSFLGPTSPVELEETFHVVSAKQVATPLMSQSEVDDFLKL